jgi:hypothetical protein
MYSYTGGYKPRWGRNSPAETKRHTVVIMVNGRCTDEGPVPARYRRRSCHMNR